MLVQQLDLDEYVKIKDWVGLEEKKILLNNSTALILPTYTEGIPNVILEAMASGIPIITTPVGGIPSILTENINCLFFQPGNVNEMAEKIEFLFKNESFQNKLSLNNFEKIKQYDAIIIVEKLYKIYKKLL